MTPSIVMVHGAFCGGWAFDDFRAPFEAAGFRCLTPDLRGHAPSAGEAEVARATMTDYARDIAALCAAQPAPPILIGHSLGGLVAQMAATRARVAALILLAPSAPRGVAGASMEEAGSAFGLYMLGPFWTQAVAPDRGVARLYSLDHLPNTEARAVAARMVRESGRALFETLNWWLDPFMTTEVQPERIGAPVLAIAGGQDRVHPPATVRQTGARLGAEVRVFDTMSHWLIGEPGWEAVAGACLHWLAGLEAD